MSIIQHTVVESIEKRYLKLNKSDISDVDFDEQVLSQINIMLVKQECEKYYSNRIVDIS